MVVGPKLSIQHVEGKGKISIRKIQNFTVRKKRTVISISYGILLILISIVMVAINPLQLIIKRVTSMREGSFLYNMWEKPNYELRTDIWIYNYTNVPEYLSGKEKVLRVKEVGPFVFQEIRTNENLTVHEEEGFMTMKPKTTLVFRRDLSVSGLNDTWITTPNIALIAISTLAADKLTYFMNTGTYYTMSALSSKLFKNLTVHDYLWGYNDPLVFVANKVLPGWIDFGRLGILDRIYAPKDEQTEIELEEGPSKYSIRKWNGSPGLLEQGFTDLNTSIPCNTIKGSYEGLMLSPNFPKEKIVKIFRRQACRIYPFIYNGETSEKYGFNYYRYKMAEDAFSKKSDYACDCKKHCLPEGFIDISPCYYGFPITLSKLHYADVDPIYKADFEGMTPDPEADSSYIELEPTIGVPISFNIKLQINIAVRTSPANPITKPLKDKMVPLMWISLNCEGPPSNVVMLLKLALVIAPPTLIVIEVLLFLIGIFLTGQGLYRVYKPRYQIVPPKKVVAKRKKSMERRKSSVILNIAETVGFKPDAELQKQAVSLLGFNEDDGDDMDLLVSDTEMNGDID